MLVLAAVYARPAFADNPTQTITVGGYSRVYAVHVPKHVTNPAPVVFFFHGAAEDIGTVEGKYGWDTESDRNGFIVVYPQALPNHTDEPAGRRHNPTIWRDGRPGALDEGVDDVAFFSAILAALPSSYPIDTHRLYVAGFSSGAGMAQRLGVEQSAVIAAVAADASSIYVSPATIARAIPVLYIAGSADPIVPLDGGESTIFGVTQYKPPVQDTVNEWLALDGCPQQPQSTSQSSSGVTTVYGPGKNGATVTFLLLSCEGHHWSGAKEDFPGSAIGPIEDPISTDDVAWQFFVKHPLP